jgi:hypothetical protein
VKQRFLGFFFLSFSFFSILAALGFEFRTSHLLSRCSTIFWAFVDKPLSPSNNWPLPSHFTWTPKAVPPVQCNDFSLSASGKGGLFVGQHEHSLKRQKKRHILTPKETTGRKSGQRDNHYHPQEGPLGNCAFSSHERPKENRCLSGGIYLK